MAHQRSDSAKKPAKAARKAGRVARKTRKAESVVYKSHHLSPEELKRQIETKPIVTVDKFMRITGCTKDEVDAMIEARDIQEVPRVPPRYQQLVNLATLRMEKLSIVADDLYAERLRTERLAAQSVTTAEALTPLTESELLSEIDLAYRAVKKRGVPIVVQMMGQADLFIQAAVISQVRQKFPLRPSEPELSRADARQEADYFDDDD